MALTTSAQAAGKVCVLLIGAASIVVVTRYLGAGNYGKMSLALAYVGAFGVLADAGLLTVTVREASRRPERTAELVGNALTLRLLLALGTVAAATGLALLLPYSEQVRLAVLIAGGPVALGLLNSAVVAVFQSRLEMDRVAVADVIGRAAAFGATVAAAALDLGFYVIVATGVVGTGVTLAITATLARRRTTLRFRADLAVWRELLAAGLPIGLSVVLTELYFRADTFIVSIFRPIEDVGLYSLAFRIVELGSSVPTLLLVAIFPLLARYVQDDPPRARAAVQTATDLLAALAVPVAVVGPFLAADLVGLLGGDDFAGAGDALAILFGAAALSFLNGLFGYALIAAGRQMSALLISVAALVANLGLNLALVPAFGIELAAASAVVSELVILGGSVLLMRRHLGWFPSLTRAVRALPAAIAAAGLVFALADAPALVQIAAGAAAYPVVLVLTGGLDRDLLRRVRA